MAETLEERFWAKVEKGGPDHCWLWTAGVNAGGYGRFKSSNGISFLAHRMSWELCVADIPDGLCVLHHCDTPPCVNPRHLFLGTRIDNALDRDRKGRGHVLRGEANGRHKLVVSQVRAIRRARGSVTQNDLARIYGVSRTLIGFIQLRRNWTHV